MAHRSGMERWERNISFSIAEAPINVMQPVDEGVIRARHGPSGVTQGDRHPPGMVLEAMQKAAGPDSEGPVFEGVLIFSPTEAPNLTVIEHPLDHVDRAGLTEDLSQLLDRIRLVNFNSDTESKSLQFHYVSMRVGGQAAAPRRPVARARHVGLGLARGGCAAAF